MRVGVHLKCTYRLTVILDFSSIFQIFYYISPLQVRLDERRVQDILSSRVSYTPNAIIRVILHTSEGINEPSYPYLIRLTVEIQKKYREFRKIVQIKYHNEKNPHLSSHNVIKSLHLYQPKK